MKDLRGAVTLLLVGLLLIAVAPATLRWPFADIAAGELRCESGGTLVVKIAVKDYALNGMASTRYPPIQGIWNHNNFPERISIAQCSRLNSL